LLPSQIPFIKKQIIMNIYVSNLDVNLKDDDLRQLFSEYGEVSSAQVVMDAFTGSSRGFGFVEMPYEAEAQKAISGLHQSSQNNRTLSVKEAQPKEVHRGSYPVGNGVVNVYRFRKN